MMQDQLSEDTQRLLYTAGDFSKKGLWPATTEQQHIYVGVKKGKKGGSKIRKKGKMNVVPRS
jgi:hypothetical protein